MSRTCVREAVKSLESRKLISVRPKIGAVVLEPSPTALVNADFLSTSAYMQQADSLIEFRKVLELSLVALAAEKATEEDLAAMRKILAEQKAALRMDRRTPQANMLYHQAILKLNIDFHKAVAEATKNPFASMVLQAISEPLTAVSRRTNEIPGVPEAGLRQHSAIYRAIREKKPEKARQAMLSHLEAAQHNAHLLETANQAAAALLPAMRPPSGRAEASLRD